MGPARFGAGLVGCEHPIDASAGGVSLLLPCGDFADGLRTARLPLPSIAVSSTRSAWLNSTRQRTFMPDGSTNESRAGIGDDFGGAYGDAALNRFVWIR
jgi:hypothetical protein